MNKKNVIGLFLLGFLVMTGLFTGVHYMTNMEANIEIEQIQKDITKDDNSSNNAKNSEALVSDSQLTLSSNQSNEQKDTVKTNELPGLDSVKTDDTIADETIEKVQGEKLTEASDNQETPDSNGISNIEEPVEAPQISETPKPDTILADNTDNVLTSSNIKDLSIEDTLGNSVLTAPELELIYDCNEVDYEAYIPKTVFDSKIETMLDIDNPELNIEAEAAILFDAKTKEVLFYKNPIEAVFPASTAKLLTSLVTLDWCNETEEVTIGEEINMIASDSSQASIKVGQVLTIRNILEGMLLPSGNDAAYAAAAYVGKKSLQNIDATDEEGILEFTRLMNIKAKSLGVKNSVFKTPDGYDALGQYTTAYDMGLIGLAARENQVILEISQKSRSRNVFPSGEDITWENTNSLINKDKAKFYSKATGLKTGSSTMAGRCLVASASDNNREVLCVILNSSSSGRYDDSITLLKYGLK
ncbi:MAG: D-alanyl-D-alanine carboxypeptidase [Clostridiales bacterium]|nr:D-alanyl-D-alanine carboxypeptidase [Clostridiales bacterium]